MTILGLYIDLWLSQKNNSLSSRTMLLLMTGDLLSWATACQRLLARRSERVHLISESWLVSDAIRLSERSNMLEP